MKPDSGLCIKVIIISRHYLFSFEENSFLYNIDNTKFKNYLGSCFEIRPFVLSKFEIIMIHCYG